MRLIVCVHAFSAGMLHLCKQCLKRAQMTLPCSRAHAYFHRQTQKEKVGQVGPTERTLVISLLYGLSGPSGWKPVAQLGSLLILSFTSAESLRVSSKFSLFLLNSEFLTWVWFGLRHAAAETNRFACMFVMTNESQTRHLFSQKLLHCVQFRLYSVLIIFSSCALDTRTV